MCEAVGHSLLGEASGGWPDAEPLSLREPCHALHLHLQPLRRGMRALNLGCPLAHNRNCACLACWDGGRPGAPGPTVGPLLPRGSRLAGLNFDAIHALAMAFDLHPLAVEDAVHVPQRIKCDVYDSCLYLSLIYLYLEQQVGPQVVWFRSKPTVAVPRELWRVESRRTYVACCTFQSAN